MKDYQSTIYQLLDNNDGVVWESEYGYEEYTSLKEAMKALKDHENFDRETVKKVSFGYVDLHTEGDYVGCSDCGCWEDWLEGDIVDYIDVEIPFKYRGVKDKLEDILFEMDEDEHPITCTILPIMLDEMDKHNLDTEMYNYLKPYFPY